MTDLSGYTILLVGLPDASHLRERLLDAGATVHVAAEPAAPLWARAKKIDAAFIGFDVVCAPQLAEELETLGVRVILTADHTEPLIDEVTASYRVARQTPEIEYVH